VIILGAKPRFYSPLFWLILWTSSVFLICALIAIGGILIFFGKKSSNSGSFDQKSPRQVEAKLLHASRQALKRGLDIKSELRLLVMNTRPDAKEQEKQNGQPRMQISFRGYSVPVALRSGQTVYFDIEKINSSKTWNGPPAPLTIASLPTAWKITPIALDEEVFVEVASQEDKAEFLLEKTDDASSPFYERARNSEWFKKIQTAKSWMIDCVSSSEGKAKIGMHDPQKIIPVSQGDFLFYASGEWQKGQIEFAKGRPLAKILGANDKGLEVLVWDETGFFREKVVISPLTVAPYSFAKLDSLFSSLKQRNSSEVSCIMGKRRVVLKPGTWWIKSAKGWKRLKTRLEMEDYLSYRLLGELVIIEGLESFQGKCVLKGKQVDLFRMSEQPFSLNVAESPGRIKQATLPSSPSTPERRESKPVPLIRGQRENQRQ
jgi:hypothetical protein